MLEGTLGHDALARIEHHVDRCEQCASVVAGLGAMAPMHPDDHDEFSPADPDHYALGEEIARGGMGRILRARDRRLGREVAIKENSVRTGDAMRRFAREARITARLQHPSIVQVHEAGVWETGEPYFTMQLVRGRSLDEVVAQAKTLDRRLALVPNVLAVADAIAYAHSERVIHRDLKPKNIIVGDFGETVVIDWGLAKDLSARIPDVEAEEPYRAAPRADGQTVTGQVLGTPAYMPPEQALGDPVDERVDVYALGAVLFHVLAARPPVAGKTGEEVLATIVAGDVLSLADVQPDVPPDLLAIVGKAMALDPAQRYPTARELAEDLRQFQTGQLVSAHRYSLGQLVVRWLRRHRAAVTVAAAAVALLAAGGVVSLRRILHAEATAETARDAAEHNRADAEDLMGFMLGDLRDKLQPLGKLDLLDTVAKKATAYYARPTSETDRGQRAVALVRLGDVLLAQGHTADALVEYRDALATTTALVAEDPSNDAWQRNLSIQHLRVGGALAAQGDAAGAAAEYRADLALTAALAERAPADLTRQRDLSVSHERLGDILDTQGHTAEAIAEYREDLALGERIAAAAPSAEHDRDVAVPHEKIGEALREHGDGSAALVELRAARAIDDRLIAHDPDNAVWLVDLAVNDGQVADVMTDQDDLAGALAEQRAGLAIEQRLVARDASNADWQSELASRHASIARLLRKQDALGDALAEYRAALAIEDKLAAQDPTHAEREHDVEASHRGIGEVLELQGDHAAAFAEFRTVLAIASELAGRDPSNAVWKRDLAMAHEKLGQAHEQAADLDAALADYRACLDLRVALSATDPGNVPWLNDVAVAHYNLAAALAKRDVAAALVEHRAAMAVTQAVLARTPDVADRRHDLADSHEQIGLLLRDQHDPTARAELAAALAIYAANPDWHDDAAKVRTEIARL
jgi:tetratricopeptide (TPR) repeat protein